MAAMTSTSGCVIQECLPESRSDYEALLFDYAVGALDEALSLMVAAHMTLSPCARRRVAGFEALGGALIESGCEPVPMSSACMARVMAQLDADTTASEAACRLAVEGRPGGLPLPDPLCAYVRERNLRWKRCLPGIRAADIAAGCGKFRVRLVHIAPQSRVPVHSHSGIEVTVVLRGSYRDGQEAVYRCGDMDVHTGAGAHGPLFTEEGCLCLLLTEGPARPAGWFAGMINRLLRF